MIIKQLHSNHRYSIYTGQTHESLFWYFVHLFLETDSLCQHVLKFKTSCSKALPARIKICAITPAECPMRKNRLSANEKA